MSKVKMLLDVVEEVKKEAPQDVPNWNSKFAESKVNLQNHMLSRNWIHFCRRKFIVRFTALGPTPFS